jgi:hypothetical protein
MPERGYIDHWRPQQPTREFLAIVNTILTTYREQLPLTLRQIYYRLVAVHNYPKTRSFYDNLSRILTTARRARWKTDEGRLLFNAMRDDSLIESIPDFYRSERSFWDAVKNTGKHLRLDRMQGQQRRLVLWCEAAGMVPQLERIADPYGIAVYCSGGFDRVTGKRDIGRRLALSRQPVTIIHIGDHDPSGIHVFEAMGEDIIAFARDINPRVDIEVVRLAITPAQAAAYGVPDNGPPSANDKRRFDYFATRCSSITGTEYEDCDPHITWQAEGLDPATLAALVREAIEARFDRAVYAAILEEEEKLRAIISAKLAALG